MLASGGINLHFQNSVVSVIWTSDNWDWKWVHWPFSYAISQIFWTYIEETCLHFVIETFCKKVTTLMLIKNLGNKIIAKNRLFTRQKRYHIKNVPLLLNEIALIEILIFSCNSTACVAFLHPPLFTTPNPLPIRVFCRGSIAFSFVHFNIVSKGRHIKPGIHVLLFRFVIKI